MTKIVNRGSFLTVQLDSGYPKYFGYNPHFGGINEPGADINKLGDITHYANHTITFWD